MPVEIKASAKAIEEQSTKTDGVNPPEGYHIFKLTKVELKPSKAGDPQLVCSWKLVGENRTNDKPKANYWPIRDYVQLTGDTTEWKRAQFLLAVGKPTKGRQSKMSIEIEPNRPGTVIGALALGRVQHEGYTDNDGNAKTSAKLGAILPYEGEVAHDDTEVEEVETEPVESDEIFDNDTDSGDTEDSYEPWTREDLVKAGKDAIKTVADNFGIGVTGKTLKVILDEILEAQEAYLKGDEGDTSELDEDEPF
jgi:hypothetical protein